MVEHLGWQSIFFLNVPIGIVAFFVATRTVKESVSEEERQLDIPGLILGTGALFSLTYALIEANQKGWSDPLIVSTLVAGVILIVALLYWELHAPHPMMPLKFFRIPAFSAGNTVAFSVSLGMFATFFFLSLYMQLIRGYTPFQAGVRFLADDPDDRGDGSARGQVRPAARIAGAHDLRPAARGRRTASSSARSSRWTRRSCCWCRST